MTPEDRVCFIERSGEYRGWLVLRVWVPDDEEEEQGAGWWLLWCCLVVLFVGCGRGDGDGGSPEWWCDGKESEGDPVVCDAGGGRERRGGRRRRERSMVDGCRFSGVNGGGRRGREEKERSKGRQRFPVVRVVFSGERDGCEGEEVERE
ncbi:hypothetical protein HAX54_048999 [Datura stramonium]|uniref:Uncharacterized protein n=1 Tax=Datura stramonium TaxID=4076 RepID=A0ABS8WK06_DATST|nr:hypothetical protein [Datura stramonium]